MKPTFVAHAYNRIFAKVYSNVGKASEQSTFQGRLLSIPLALFSLVTIPIAKLGRTAESLLITVLNLLLWPLHSAFKLEDVRYSIKATFMDLIGLILSPLTAIFSATSVFMAMMIHPQKASKQFIDACRHHPTAHR